MRRRRILLCIVALSAFLSIGAIAAFASPFVVFPIATELVSPDGRYAVRNVEPRTPPPISSEPSTPSGSQRTGRGRFPQTLRYLGVASAAGPARCPRRNRICRQADVPGIGLSRSAAQDAILLDSAA
jgi:hypothetical protein